MAGVSGAALYWHNTAKADDGRILDQHLVNVLSFRDGRIQRMDMYLSEPAGMALDTTPSAQ